MLIFMSLGIRFWIVFQNSFFFSISNSRGELGKDGLKIYKRT